MKEIDLGGGKVALVDDEDFERLAGPWHISTRGYATRMEKDPKTGKWVSVFMHRRVMGIEHGDPRRVDHIDGNGLDNRRKNLRPCSHAENMRNCKKSATNKSGFKGVCWRAKAKKWAAHIHFNGKQKFLGLFETPNEAHEAYKEAAISLHGQFANFGDAS